MRTSFWTRFNRSLQNARRWYEATPERALDQAYDAALMIKAIEDEHFGGEAISNHSGKFSENTFAYFQSELKKYLKIAELRLSEFKASRFFFNTTDPSAKVRTDAYSGGDRDRASIILEKLQFIDEIIDRYKPRDSDSLSLVPVSQIEQPNSITAANFGNGQVNNFRNPGYSTRQTVAQADNSVLDQTGVLPRSILGTLNRIKRDLDPNAEREVVQTYRSTRTKTLIAVRFILLLIIVPLITQQLSKVLLWVRSLIGLEHRKNGDFY